jgi:hypothetical protein
VRANSHITHATDSWPEAFAALLFTRFLCFEGSGGISLLTEKKINHIFLRPRMKNLVNRRIKNKHYV